MNLFNNKYSSFCSLSCVNIIVLLIFSYILPLTYEDNDDIVMLWIANGIYTGMPNPHLVYMSAIYGCLLNFLYSYIPSIEWYTILFCVYQVVSITIIEYYSVKYVHKIKLLIVSIVLLYTIWALLLIRLQFTSTTALLAFAAILLLLDKHWIVGGCLLLFSSLLRFNAFGLIGLLMVPAFIYTYKKDILHSYVPLFTILVVIFGVQYANMYFYNTPDWRYFNEYNRVRGRLFDDPKWKNFGPDDLPAGITLDDTSLVAFAPDPQALSIEQMKSIVSSLDNTFWRSKIKIVCINVFVRYWFWILSFMLLIVVSYLSINKIKDKLFLIFPFFLWLSVLCLLSVNADVKIRVFVPTTIVLLYYIIVCSSRSKTQTKSYIITLIILCCMAIGGYGREVWTRYKLIDDSKTILNEHYTLINMTKGKYHIIPHGQDMKIEFFSPWQYYEIINPTQYVNSQWLMASPLNTHFNSHRDLVDGDICMFILDGTQVGDFQRSIKNHYGLSTTIDTLYRTKHCLLINFKDNNKCVK